MGTRAKLNHRAVDHSAGPDRRGTRAFRTSETGAAQVLLAAAGVTAWAIVSITVAERAIAVFTAVTVVGAAAVLTAGAATILQLDAVVIASILIVLALVVTVQARNSPRHGRACLRR